MEYDREGPSLMESKEKQQGKPGLKQFIFIYLGIVGIIAFLIPIIIINTFSVESLSQYNIYISTFSQVFILFLAGALILWKTKAPKLSVNTKDFLRSLPRLLCVTVITFLISRLLIDGIKWVYIGSSNDFSIVHPPSGMDMPTFMAALLCLALVPGICEELFYRVAAYHLLHSYKIPVIMILSTAMFCLSHIASGWESMISALFLGYVLMAQYIKNQNYLSIVIMHFLFNTLFLFFTHRMFWVTDCVYIGSRASSGTECIFWGLIYISGAIALTSALIVLTHLPSRKKEPTLL